MTTVQLVIVPGILLAAFLAVLAVIAIRVAAAHLSGVLARRDRDRAAAGQERWRYESLAGRSRQQADAIAAVITELAARPATYQTFPEDVLRQLMAAHEAATTPERMIPR
jgi:hypothetical protein